MRKKNFFLNSMNLISLTIKITLQLQNYTNNNRFNTL